MPLKPFILQQAYCDISAHTKKTFQLAANHQLDDSHLLEMLGVYILISLILQQS